MGTLITFIGFGWFFVGVVNFLMVNNFTAGNESVLGMSLIMHVMFYFFPGIIVGSLGMLLRRSKKI